MGTRHLQTVIAKEGDIKVSQYGQWDGYPSGQGVDILNFLKTANLDKYQENLSVLPQITPEQAKEVDKDKNWTKNYPYLSRDCGSEIHRLILHKEVPFVQHCSQEEADKWCEGFYTIDFSKGLFTTEYYGKVISYPLDNLPTKKEYLKNFEDKDE